MILRAFRESGISTFREMLANCRERPDTPVPRDLLEDDSHTVRLTPEVHVEPRSFSLRADAADYLDQLLEGFPVHKTANNAGLWTWLTFFFLDEVCPNTDGARQVRNDYHYIFEPKNPRHFYRHLLFLAWHAKRLAPQHNRLFLRQSVSNLDTVSREVFKRLYLIRIPCIFEVLDRLYWDPERGKARVGLAGSKRPKSGDLTHRLPSRIRQLEKTYDLQSLTADKMLELLGDEFQVPTAEKKLQRA